MPTEQTSGSKMQTRKFDIYLFYRVLTYPWEGLIKSKCTALNYMTITYRSYLTCSFITGLLILHSATVILVSYISGVHFNRKYVDLANIDALFMFLNRSW